MALESFTWFGVNPHGPNQVIFGEAPYVLRGYDGTASSMTMPQSIKGPFQVGATVINVDIPLRLFTIQIRVMASGFDVLANLKAELMRSFIVEPTTGTTAPTIGALQYQRFYNENDLVPQTLELICCPKDSPEWRDIPGAPVADCEITFEAYDPYWRETEDSSISLVGSVGGFQFDASDIQFPFESILASSSVTITNNGDVTTPFFAQVFGDCTTFRLINQTYNETLEVTGNVPAGQYVEVNTAFGQKTLTLVNGSTRTDIFGRLSLTSIFWQLRPGANEVRFEATTNVSGSVIFSWRERYAGI